MASDRSMVCGIALVSFLRCQIPTAVLRQLHVPVGEPEAQAHAGKVLSDDTPLSGVVSRISNEFLGNSLTTFRRVRRYHGSLATSSGVNGREDLISRSRRSDTAPAVAPGQIC